MVMMKVTIIRHGKIPSNIKRLYAGCRTDEPLTEEGRAELQCVLGSRDADTSRVMLFVSPMIRAGESAEIMFPGLEQHVVSDLREMDFGIFEGRNHDEMMADEPFYKEWFDSGCTLAIPGGESMQSFTDRSMEGFRRAVKQATCSAGEDKHIDEIYIVAHGGTLMSVMSTLTGGGYYDFYSLNGCGYTIDLEVDDAGNIVAAGAYDRFCGGLHSGPSGR